MEITARVLHMSKSGGGARLSALGAFWLAHCYGSFCTLTVRNKTSASKVKPRPKLVVESVQILRSSDRVKSGQTARAHSWTRYFQQLI